MMKKWPKGTLLFIITSNACFCQHWLLLVTWFSGKTGLTVLSPDKKTSKSGMLTYICKCICRVLAGARPGQPANCPDRISRLMEQCWKESPAERPAFSNLKMDIQDAYAAEIATHAAAESDDQNLCVVCLEKQTDFALYPCGHKCVCEEHAMDMCNRGMCPVCRTPVQSHLRIWQSRCIEHRMELYIFICMYIYI